MAINETLQNRDGIKIEQDDIDFAKIEFLLEATGGLSLSQVCGVTGLEPSTIQNWVKRGWVAHPIGKRYEEVHIARILIINALKECIKLEHIAALMTYVNGSAKDGSEAVIKESMLYKYLREARKRSAKAPVETVVEQVLQNHQHPNLESRVRLHKALTLMVHACVCTVVKRRTEAMVGEILDELYNPEAAASKARAASVQATISAAIPISGHPIPSLSNTINEEPAAVSDTADRPAAAPVRTAAPLKLPDIEPIMPDIPIPVATKTAAAPQPVTPIKITLDDPVVPEEPPDEAAQTRKTISQALREWDIGDISSVEKIIIDHDEDARNSSKAEEEGVKPAGRPWYIRKNK